jgi:hypothetical protein
MNRIHCKALVAAGIAMSVSTCAQTFAITDTFLDFEDFEAFTSDDGPPANRIHRLNNRPAAPATTPDYGFSNTDHILGEGSGELGGTIIRKSDLLSYYGIDVGELSALGDISSEFGEELVSARVEAASFGAAPNETRFFFGYFNTANTAVGTPNPFLGMRLQTNSDPDRLRNFQLRTSGMQTDIGTGEGEVGAILQSEGPGSFSFRMVRGMDANGDGAFDADTDSNSGATVYGSVNDLEDPTNRILITDAQLAALDFDTFGLRQDAGTAEVPSQAFFDNLTFTSALFPGGLIGDFNNDATLNAADIDLLCNAINTPGAAETFDVNEDGTVDTDDLTSYVQDLLNTSFGDTDTDGDVDLNDLGNLASGFNVPGEKRWSRGNFDCDNDVDLPDLGTLATNFQAGRAAALAQFEALVPEPTAFALSAVTVFGLFCRRRKAQVPKRAAE